MAYFPNFSETARLGFQSGMEIGQGQNPLGSFIKTMLADWQQRRIVGQEYGMKRGLLEAEYGMKEKLPLNIAELAKTQAEGELKGEELKLFKEAKKKYDAGDKSPEVLKALGMYATPNIFNLIGSDFTNPIIPQVTPLEPSPVQLPITKGKPKYNPKTQKLQYNKTTGEYRVVPK